ncbi:MAG: hypothetical protein AAB215_07790 [Planctomycetota bacterium]
MTVMLEQAFAEAAKLSPAEQDAIARRLLAELADEKAWDAAFSGSQDALARLAAEALAEHRTGRTLPLDLERL